MKPFEILSIGDRVASGSYQPHNGYSRVITYSNGRRLFSLVHESVGAGPDRLVVAASAWTQWQQNAPPIRISRQRVVVANRSFARSRIPVYCSRLPRFPAKPVLTRAIETLLRQEAPPESLVFLLDTIPVRGHTFDQAYREYMRNHSQALLQCLRAGPHSKSTRRHAMQAACGLAGAGRGLTPSGDDFLAGTLLALQVHATSATVAAWRSVFQQARRATSGLSAHFLTLAQQGRAPEAVRQLIRAMDIDDFPGTIRWACRVLAWGSTSGADLLVGFTLATQALTRADQKE